MHLDFTRVSTFIRPAQVVQYLVEMVNIPSPTGREEAMARYIVGTMRARGYRTRFQEVQDTRSNAIVELPGAGDGYNLLFTGHMDTSYDGDEEYLTGVGYKPEAVRREGWVVGLGSNNMKAGLAAAMGAMDALVEARVQLRGDVILGAVVGEIEKAPIDEYRGQKYVGYGVGTRHLITHGVTADFAILGEQTDLSVSIGNLGSVWAKITTYGTVSHSVFADEMGAANAIDRMLKVYTALKKWVPGYQSRNTFLDVEPSVTISAIQGGWPWRLSRNPIECSLYVDVRTVPGQTPDGVKRELRSVLAKVADEDPGFKADLILYQTTPPTVIEQESPVVRAVSSAHWAVTGTQPKFLFRRPAADSTHFHAYGIPCCVYGPGGQPAADMQDQVPEWLRGQGEYVSEKDLLTTTKVFLAAALELCTATPGRLENGGPQPRTTNTRIANG